MTNDIPIYWIEFLDEHQFRGKAFDIPEENDLSELGASLELMKEEQCQEEMKDAYPGLVVINDNYIPVGSCTIGSGDPYFINAHDGLNGKLYRIYHDEVFDENYNKAQAIDVVLNDYRELLEYLV